MDDYLGYISHIMYKYSMTIKNKVFDKKEKT